MNTEQGTMSRSVSTEQGNTLRSLWDFLCSLKLAMFLLLSLAVTSIIGTVIPQGNVPPAYIASISEAKAKLYLALGFFDMYHSWWFVLLLAALAANLIACSLKRLPHIWKVITKPVTVMEESLQKSLPNVAVLKVRGDADALKERLLPILSSEFSSPLVTSKDGAYHLFAQKMPWCRLAVYAVHLSIVVVFIGAIVGSLFGYKAYVNIPEGESVSTITGRGQKKIDLGFSVLCEKFNVSFYDTGAPKEFKSVLTVLENGQPVKGYEHVPVIVNDPLSYKGITFYQSSYGKNGDHQFTMSNLDGSNPVVLKLSGEGSVQLPDGGGMHILESTEDVSPFEPGHSGPAANIEIHSATGGTRRVVVYANHPELNRLAAEKNGGPMFSYSRGQERVYTGLQVARDPGVPIVWAGCILMVIGVYLAFFVSHRRLWVRVKNGEVVIGGNASKNPAGFQLAFERIVARIRAELSAGEAK